MCWHWGEMDVQLPTMLGPAVHHGKDTTHKTMSNVGA